MTDLSRRHLIQGAVAAGAALAGSTVAVASPKQKWDEVVDVIVIVRHVYQPDGKSYR